jgi:hypothetical protein
MLRAVTPGLFVSHNILSCDPNPGIRSVSVSRSSTGGQALRLIIVYTGWATSCPQVPRVKKTSGARWSVTAKYPPPVSFILPHCWSFETLAAADIAAQDLQCFQVSQQTHDCCFHVRISLYHISAGRCAPSSHFAVSCDLCILLPSITSLGMYWFRACDVDPWPIDL